MTKSGQFTAIMRLLSSGRRDDAKQLFDSEQNFLTASERAECVGTFHFYAREFQEALSYYEAAMLGTANYDVARYHYILATQFEFRGNLVEAFKRYQAAIEIEPEFVDSYFDLGGLLVKIQDLEGAYQCFRDANRLDPNDERIHFNLIEILTHLSRTDATKYGALLDTAIRKYGASARAVGRPNVNQSW